MAKNNQSLHCIHNLLTFEKGNIFIIYISDEWSNGDQAFRVHNIPFRYRNATQGRFMHDIKNLEQLCLDSVKRKVKYTRIHA